MINPLPLARRVIAVTAVALTATVAAACTIDSTVQDKSSEQSAAAAAGNDAAAESSAAAKKKGLEVSVKDGATDVDPSETITVKTEGKMKTVTMTNELGVEVAEKLSADSKTWSTDEVLGYNHTYTIQAEDVDGNKKTVTFATPQAAGVSEVALSPIPGAEVGVGQVIGVRFGNYVTDRKAA